MNVQMFDSPPLNPTLSGLAVEYRIIQIYSRDAGKREASFAFDVGQGTQDLGFRSESDILFRCLPAREITLRVKDEHGKPTTASLRSACRSAVENMGGSFEPAAGDKCAEGWS